MFNYAPHDLYHRFSPLVQRLLPAHIQNRKHTVHTILLKMLSYRHEDWLRQGIQLSGVERILIYIFETQFFVQTPFTALICDPQELREIDPHRILLLQKKLLTAPVVLYGAEEVHPKGHLGLVSSCGLSWFLTPNDMLLINTEG